MPWAFASYAAAEDERPQLFRAIVACVQFCCEPNLGERLRRPGIRSERPTGECSPGLGSGGVLSSPGLGSGGVHSRALSVMEPSS